jgi:diguanylate cyclase (GGDEF)-like protein
VEVAPDNAVDGLAGPSARQSTESALLRSIVETVAALSGIPDAYISFPDPTTGVSTIRAAVGAFANRVGAGPPRGASDRAESRAAHDAVVTVCVREDELARAGIDALIEAPVGLPGPTSAWIGLGVSGAADDLTSEHCELLAHLGQFASLRLENAHLEGLAQNELRERRRVEDELGDVIAWLRRSEDELRRSRSETIMRLAHAAEFRSFETAVHVERMSRYCALLASRIGFPEERVELIKVASTLHDIGKIAIPDHVLLKPGPLSAEERLSMMRHAFVGNELLSGSASEVLELAALIALTHHERYDGSGYPCGLAGDAIPVEGRIAAVADVFDALLSDRVYRPGYPLDRAMAIMREGRGTHFDPEIFDLFLACVEELETPAQIEQATGAAPSLVSPGESEQPIVLAPRDRGGTVLDPALLAQACRDALSALEEVGGGRAAIDLAVARLVNGWEGRLIASVYLVEHGRLWVVSQRGYSDVVHDGFPLDQGVMARAVRTGETQFLADVSQDPDFIAAARGLVSEVAVPFPAEAPVGVFNLETLGSALPPEAASLFAPLAAALAGRLESMREGLGLDIASLTRLCVHASSLRGTTAISEFATRTLGRLLALDSAQLSLRSPSGAVRMSSYWRRPDSRLNPLSVAALESLDRIRAGDDVAASFGVVHADEVGRSGAADARAPWIVWLPLRVAGEEIGTLIGRSATRELSRDELEAVSLVAQHVAALIDIAQRLRREQRAAATDVLTGLLNRRGFDERFVEELARAGRHDEPLALLLIDCDGLKLLNDREGHTIGDQALQRVATCIREGKRVSDVAARIGGDEFALVLSGADGDEAAAVAERIRAALAQLPVQASQRLTASLGLAVFPEDATTTAGLMAAADLALYQAKREGGDRVLAAA